MTERANPNGLRGAVLVCDELYQVAHSGKWVIAGTYNNITTTEPHLHFHRGLNVYARIQADTAKVFPFSLLIIDRKRQPNEAPLVRFTGQVVVQDPNRPAEFGVRLPMPVLRRPVPRSKMKPGFGYGLHLTVWLEVDCVSVASSPLLIIFRAPGETRHASKPPSPAPEPEPKPDGCGGGR